MFGGLIPVSLEGLSQNVLGFWLVRRLAQGTWSKVGMTIGNRREGGDRAETDRPSREARRVK